MVELWDFLKAAAVIIISGAVIIGTYSLFSAINQSTAPAASESFYLPGIVTSAHNYSSGGGFLSGASEHDVVFFKASDGTAFSQNFSCSWYNAGMNVTIIKKIQYPNPSGDYPPFGSGGTVVIASGTTRIAQTLTDLAGNVSTSFTVVDYSQYEVSYAVSGVPDGC